MADHSEIIAQLEQLAQPYHVTDEDYDFGDFSFTLKKYVPPSDREVGVEMVLVSVREKDLPEKKYVLFFHRHFHVLPPGFLLIDFERISLPVYLGVVWQFCNDNVPNFSGAAEWNNFFGMLFLSGLLARE